MDAAIERYLASGRSLRVREGRRPSPPPLPPPKKQKKGKQTDAGKASAEASKKRKREKAGPSDAAVEARKTRVAEKKKQRARRRLIISTSSPEQDQPFHAPDIEPATSAAAAPMPSPPGQHMPAPSEASCSAGSRLPGEPRDLAESSHPEIQEGLGGAMEETPRLDDPVVAHESEVRAPDHPEAEQGQQKSDEAQSAPASDSDPFGLRAIIDSSVVFRLRPDTSAARDDQLSGRSGDTEILPSPSR